MNCIFIENLMTCQIFNYHKNFEEEFQYDLMKEIQHCNLNVANITAYEEIISTSWCYFTTFIFIRLYDFSGCQDLSQLLCNPVIWYSYRTI